MKKRVSHGALVHAIVSSRGPSLHNVSRAENVALHDDRSMYTGVHSQGGPTTVDTYASVKLEHLLDRSDADVRGRKMDYTDPDAYWAKGQAAATQSGGGGGGGLPLHPDWYEVENPNATGPNDRVRGHQRSRFRFRRRRTHPANAMGRLTVLLRSC